MGISISGPSTQIPTNVVEIGNEISQNAINAISASTSPSTGNPFTTSSAVSGFVNSTIQSKQNAPYVNWPHPFPVSQGFLLMLNGSTGVWWPILGAGQVFGVDYSNVVSQNTTGFNFDFFDSNSNYIALNDGGNPPVTTNFYNSWTSLGGWDPSNQTTYSNSTYGVSVPASGPQYVGDWNNYLASAQFYDGNVGFWRWRYVFRDNSSGFYTADNDFNPPS